MLQTRKSYCFGKLAYGWVRNMRNRVTKHRTCKKSEPGRQTTSILHKAATSAHFRLLFASSDVNSLTVELGRVATKADNSSILISFFFPSFLSSFFCFFATFPLAATLLGSSLIFKDVWSPEMMRLLWLACVFVELQKRKNQVKFCG